MTFAVVLKETGLPVGSIGIMRNANIPTKDNEEEIAPCETGVEKLWAGIKSRLRNRNDIRGCCTKHQVYRQREVFCHVSLCIDPTASFHVESAVYFFSERPQVIGKGRKRNSFGIQISTEE